MRRVLFIAFLSLSVVATAFAKDIVDPTKRFEVDPFEKIFLEGAYEVHFEKTDGAPYVEITARQRVLEQIVPVVTEGKLTIAKTGNVMFSNAGVTVKCYGKSISEVIISGASNMSCENGFKTDKLYLEMNGAGSLELSDVDAYEVDMRVNGAGSGNLYDIDCVKLKVVVNGAGGAEITGSAETADMELNGVGGIDIKELKVENLSSRVAGIGSIKR